MSDADAAVVSSAALARRPLSLVRTPRVLQVVLGLLWLLDGALQFQSFMFGRAFVTTYILPNASGQPAVVAWVITNIGHFLEPHIAVWNTFFALIQVLIGAGLLWRRSVRPALLVSFFWVLGVWVIGEGLGMVLTGSASALTGAPGSVLLYGLLGLMAWPSHSAHDDDAHEPVGVASSAAGAGIGGPLTPLVVWSGFWSLAAVLFLLPDNRTQTSLSSAITGMAAGEPRAYAHFLTHFGNHFGSVGDVSTWVLALASLVIALGPLVARRPHAFLVAGGVLSALFWFSGQGFGGIFTGSGTDPNTAPLVILLALAMVPAVVPDPLTWRPPLAVLFTRSPVVAIGGALALGLALFLSAAYPVAAQETVGTAMAGMTGMSSSGSSPASTSASTASCTAGNNGAARSGLDLTNTPNMVMGGGNLGMNMNGSDASAAAGLNTTTQDWHYTGPALPLAYGQELLNHGGNGPGQIHMAESGCATDPSSSQEINAFQYVQATSQAVARFPNPSVAMAAGYVAVSPTNYPIVYYVNPTIIAANATAKRTLDPQHVDGLIFAAIPSGQEVLAAAFYVLPSAISVPPMPYGALVQWHQRTDTCGPSVAAASPLEITGTTPCAGSVHRSTPYLTMVWEVPVAGGPLAIQPPDIQIMEAAIMASLSS
jgi:hypothetical protein